MAANDQLGQKACGMKSGRPFRHKAKTSPSVFDALVYLVVLSGRAEGMALGELSSKESAFM